MKQTTFRIRIIITVIVVVSLFSSFAFYIYSNYLSKRIYRNTEENTVEILNFINEPKRIANLPHNNQEFKKLIDYMNSKDQVINAYFVNYGGMIQYPYDKDSVNANSLFQLNLPLIHEDLTFKTFTHDDKTFSRAFVRLHNTQECYGCHSHYIDDLGYVVYDFSVNQTRKNIAFTRKFSISFTIFMVIILGAFVLIMHYRFVKRGLSKFKGSIEVINSGNLNERVPIANSKELGELAKCFNIMLDNFQETRKQLSIYHEKELQDAQKLATIGEMSARLAHEIRNPITGIANAIEIIAEDTKDEQHKPILQEIKRQAKRVNEAVSNLLRYSKSGEIRPVVQDINELIKSIVFFMKNQTGTNKITFVMQLDPDLPDFSFDKEKMENVLMNLCMNAIQAIEGKGIITFRSSFNGNKDEIVVSVDDSGMGITKDKINEIFKPFYTTKTEGTGLGMAIIKDIIDKHKGRISIESEPGKGSTFTINLPIYNS